MGWQGEIGIRIKDLIRVIYMEVCYVGIQISLLDLDDISLLLFFIQIGDFCEELFYLFEEVKVIKMLIEKFMGVVDDKKIEFRIYYNIDIKGDYVKELELKKCENLMFVWGEFVLVKLLGYFFDDVEEV